MSDDVTDQKPSKLHPVLQPIAALKRQCEESGKGATPGDLMALFTASAVALAESLPMPRWRAGDTAFVEMEPGEAMEAVRVVALYESEGKPAMAFVVGGETGRKAWAMVWALKPGPLVEEKAGA